MTISKMAELFLLALMASCAASDPDVESSIAVRFIKCIDGDTFTCEIPGAYPPLLKTINVRIRGIDAPELHDKQPEIKRRALEAKDYLEKRLSEAKKIELRKLGKDKYFRILADVYIDGVDIAKEMLDKKLVVPYDGGSKKSIGDEVPGLLPSAFCLPLTRLFIPWESFA